MHYNQGTLFVSKDDVAKMEETTAAQNYRTKSISRELRCPKITEHLAPLADRRRGKGRGFFDPKEGFIKSV